MHAYACRSLYILINLLTFLSLSSRKKMLVDGSKPLLRKSIVDTH